MTRAVVVGSGPNGLAAALRLARAGVAVTVLEAADVPGGGLRSGELTVPDLIHDHCASTFPLAASAPALGPALPKALWRRARFDLAHPLPGGRAGLLTRGKPGGSAGPAAEQARDSLGADGAQWDRLFGPLVDRFDALIAEVLGPAVHVPRDPGVLARTGVRALVPATTVARSFGGEPAAALWTGLAAHAFGRLDRPLTSAAGLLLGAAAHHGGWPVAAGGAGRIADALIDELTGLGGAVRTGVRVRSLGDIAALTDHAADVVLLDTAPPAAAQICRGHLPARIDRALRRHRYGPAAFVMHYALTQPVPWTAPETRQAAVIHLGGTAAQIAAAEAETAAGRMPAAPFVLVSQPYAADPSRAAGGAVPLQAYAHVPRGYTGDASAVITAQIERFAPGFTDTIIESRAVGPADLEAGNANLVGGDIAGGTTAGLRLLFRPRPAINPYRLGVRGLYLCSAATPPGGGVHGMAGRHAAGAALADLR